MEKKELPVEVMKEITLNAEGIANSLVNGRSQPELWEAVFKAYEAYTTKLHQCDTANKELEEKNRGLEEKIKELEAHYENDMKVNNQVIASMREEFFLAKDLLNEVLVLNEAWGDLPGEFITKVKTFLYGE